MESDSESSPMSDNWVQEFLISEKEDARRWMRCEMDLFLESLFNKLTNKLTTFVVDIHKNATNGHENLAERNSRLQDAVRYRDVHRDEVHNVASNLIPTDQSLRNDQNNLVHSQDSCYQHADDENINGDNDFINRIQQQETSLSYFSQSSLPANSQGIQNISICEPQVLIKEEVDNWQFDNSCLSSTANEQLNPETHKDDDDDCDCDDCVNGVLIKKEEDMDMDDYVPVDDDDSVEWIEDLEVDDDEEATPSLKRLRTDLAQPSKPISNEQGFCVTLSLKCLEQNCLHTFTTKDKLEDHLWNVHSIAKFRCAVKDCIVSFDSRIRLGLHLKQAHLHTTQWHCAKCSNHYPSYNRLSMHTANYHHEGQFQCSIPGCGLIAEYRGRLYNAHYKLVHEKEFVCRFPTCGHRFTNSTKWKDHERAHLGLKPYRCKWLDCGYASTGRDATVRHIRQKHFNTPLTKKERTRLNVVEPGDPNDWIEVVHEFS